MKLSELIKMASDVMNKAGDIEVVIITEADDGFLVEHAPWADAVTFPGEDQKLFAIGWECVIDRPDVPCPNHHPDYCRCAV